MSLPPPLAQPALAACADAVTAVAAVDPRQLSAAERKTRLVAIRAAIDTLEVAFDTTVAAADTAADGHLLDGATSTTAWLRHTLRLAPRDAATHVRTARALNHGGADGAAPATPAAEAVQSGAISYAHLQVIAATLADLADQPGLPPDAPTEAVALMVNLAAEVDPDALRTAARHLRYVLDPDRGKADHDRQTQARRASLAPLLDGTWRLEMLTTAEGGALLTQLLAATSAPTSSDDDRTPTQRRHDALIDAIEAAAQSEQLPINNGLSPHILVTAPPQTFLPPEAGTDHPLNELWRPSRFTDSAPIPGPLLDQLSCNATLIRIIQEPTGAVLDVGRAHRFFTSTQRTALYARDHGCRFPGCTAPWCHAHHITPWQQGGATDLANGLLLCGYHHRAVHDELWTISTGPDGANNTITFTGRNRLTTHRSAIPPPDPLARE